MPWKTKNCYAEDLLKTKFCWEVARGYIYVPDVIQVTDMRFHLIHNFYLVVIMYIIYLLS